MMNHNTTVTKTADIDRKWHLIDLSGETLGRISTQIATKLIGKSKPNYAPHLDCGDYVVVINADKIHVSGKKTTDKKYQWHSGHPGGFKEIAFRDLLAKDSRKVISLAISGMLPKNKLRSPRLKRLKIYTNDQHPYADKFATK